MLERSSRYAISQQTCFDQLNVPLTDYTLKLPALNTKVLSVQVMGKNKILVKVHPEGKYVVDLHKDIDINKVATGARVALRNDSYTLHLLLPTKVDPLVSLMKVEQVPDSTYDMIGGLDQQIKEIKEVHMP